MKNDLIMDVTINFQKSVRRSSASFSSRDNILDVVKMLLFTKVKVALEKNAVNLSLYAMLPTKWKFICWDGIF